MKKVYKLIFPWNYEKEEKWLNQMSDQGYCLRAVKWFRYEFDECEPGRYYYRQDFQTFSMPDDKKGSQQDYVNFMEGTGAKLVCNYSNWLYVKKRKSEGEFQIYSDHSSRIQYINRLLFALGFIGGLNLLLGLSPIFTSLYRPVLLPWILYLNVGVGLLLLYGCYKLYKEKKRLKKEQILFE